MENVNVEMRPLKRQLRWYRCCLWCPRQSRFHRGDTATLSVDESKRSCQVEMPVPNARRRSTSLVPAISSPKSQPKFASTQPLSPADIDSDSCRCGSEWSMGVRLCFGGGDALAATSSRTIIWTVIGMIARICASCITAPTLRLSSWFRGSPSPSSRLSTPGGISTPLYRLSHRAAAAAASLPCSTCTYNLQPQSGLLCHPSTRTLLFLWDDSPHKCMFPGFLVVCRMNYGGSTTDAAATIAAIGVAFSPPPVEIARMEIILEKRIAFPSLCSRTIFMLIRRHGSLQLYW